MVVRPRSNVFSSPETARLVSNPTCLAVIAKICSYKAKLAFRNILIIEAFVLLRCYTSYVGRCLRTCGTACLFHSRGSVTQRKEFYCLTLEDGTDRLSRNVSEQVSTYAS
jgi:ABC-type uncharacterized transport system permease subunit